MIFSSFFLHDFAQLSVIFQSFYCRVSFVSSCQINYFQRNTKNVYETPSLSYNDRLVFIRFSSYCPPSSPRHVVRLCYVMFCCYVLVLFLYTVCRLFYQLCYRHTNFYTFISVLAVIYEDEAVFFAAIIPCRRL